MEGIRLGSSQKWLDSLVNVKSNLENVRSCSFLINREYW